MNDAIKDENAWYCYVMQCADHTFYTGITNDLEKRLTAHNNGTASKYTRCRLPVQLVYSEPHASRSTASKREAQIKQLSRAQKQAFIDPINVT